MITVIKKPLLTEKATKIEYQRKYTFEVVPSANKIQIKNAVKAMFGVEVDSVRTITLHGKNKTRNTRKGQIKGKTVLRKKAIVTLKQGQTLDIVGGEGSAD